MPKAIDIHIHPPKQPGAPESRFSKAMAEYFKSPLEIQTQEELADYYQKLDMMAVVLAEDSQSAQGEGGDSNDWVASFAHNYPDTFIAFGSVDPWRGKMAVKEVERAAKELGMRGIKFVPMTQEFYPNEHRFYPNEHRFYPNEHRFYPNEHRFYPNEHRFYPIYEKMVELDLIAMFHTGTTGVGAGLPGGGGIHLKYTKPIPYIDDVAADFPDLTIIMAHPAFPWQDEQLAVMVHKPNVYMDISGWSPKYFSPNLIQYASTLLKHKVLFGSDYPALTPERWLRDFEASAILEEARPGILLGNAKKVLKL